jgi:2-methylaconitate isomerase
MNDIFMKGIDAYNPSQIDGLGSATSHTSKVIVIDKSSLANVDIDYTFFQVGIGEQIVDDKGTCGNLMAAVGAYSVNEGMINRFESQDECVVRAYNRNIDRIVHITVPLIDGCAKVSGDYLMPGVVTTGAKHKVEIQSPGGGKLGSTFPVNRITKIQVEDREYDVSIVDIVNPFVFVAAESLGIRGSELNSELSGDMALKNKLEQIRRKASVLSGLTQSEEEASGIPSIPKIAIVAKPHDYKTSMGETIGKEEIDIVAKMVSMGNFHRTFAGSGLYNLAATTMLSGTVVNSLIEDVEKNSQKVVRIGHPEGIAKVNVTLSDDDKDVEYVGVDRTARLIMKGELFISERQ